MSASDAVPSGYLEGPPYPNRNPLRLSSSNHAAVGLGANAANSSPLLIRIELEFLRRLAIVLGLSGAHSPPPPRDNLLNLCIAKDR